ncbi:response regulator transcription factor [Nocardioides sp.]|uniref:helix-turn-helix transcriptional regulator n=1 Tax=Nocardioides sp. TaxID=35761 RepID=UPI002EDB1F41
MPAQPTRVGIVGHQEVLAKGLFAMLAEHPQRVEITEPSAADVILYDVLGVHRTRGEDLQRLARENAAVILAVSRDLRPDLRARALVAGAHGWISMSVGSEELVAAVEAAAAGTDLPGQGDRLGQDVGLTPREVEVLALITQGMSNQEIAERLYLSINSVKTYIRSAYVKIGATSRARAVAWCLLHGFAPPD